MKDKYKDLKLIIECPTKEAFNSVLEHAGIEKMKEYYWNFHQEKTSICINENGGDYCYTDYFKNESPNFADYTFLTFEQFKQQYMNTIDVTGLPDNLVKNLEEQVKVYKGIYLAPKEPKQVTIEEATNSIHFTTGATLAIAEKKTAYGKLLDCQHWANEGEDMTDREYFYIQFDFSDKKYTSIGLSEAKYRSDFMFKSKEACEKFLAIKEVPELLDIFYGRK